MCLDGEGTIDVQDKRWNDGQPNNNYGNQDCAASSASGWHDGDCGSTRKIVCQRPA